MGHNRRLGVWGTVGPGLVCVMLAGAAGCKNKEAFPDTYVGVGVELRMLNTGAEVVRVIPGGPAAAAGVEAGTLIEEVDGQPLAQMSLADAVALLRGPPGSDVRLGARQKDQVFRIKLTRTSMAKAQGARAYQAAPLPPAPGHP